MNITTYRYTSTGITITDIQRSIQIHEHTVVQLQLYVDIDIKTHKYTDTNIEIQ